MPDTAPQHDLIAQVLSSCVPFPPATPADTLAMAKAYLEDPELDDRARRDLALAVIYCWEQR